MSFIEEFKELIKKHEVEISPLMGSYRKFEGFFIEEKINNLYYYYKLNEDLINKETINKIIPDN